jgi:hypothetical protein
MRKEDSALHAENSAEEAALGPAMGRALRRELSIATVILLD